MADKAEETCLQGYEYLKQAQFLFQNEGKAKAPPERLTKLLQDATGKFNSVLKNPEHDKTPEKAKALIGLVETMIQEAQVVESITPEVIEFSKHFTILENALKKLQEDIWIEGKNAETNRLEAKLNMMLGQHKSKFNPKQSENFYFNAIEKLLASNKFVPNDERTLFMIQEILELLNKAPKDRKTQGQAVFKMRGELIQCTSNLKSQKNRYFVVDDSTIKEFSKEKDWLSGPVEGKPGKAIATILFAEINAIVCHEDENKCNTIVPKNKPSKLKGSFCIHLLTRDRIYNLLSIPKKTTLEEFLEWQEVLTSTLRSYKLKKDAKKLLKKEDPLTQLNNSTTPDPSIQVKGTSYPRKFSILKMDTSQQKKIRRVHWADRNKLVTICDITKSMYPPTEWDEEEEEEEEDDNEQMVWMKRELSTMNEKHAFRILKKLFAQYEEEGLTQEVLLNLALSRPKDYLVRLADIEEFGVAKYGIFNKSVAYLKKHGKL